MHRFYIEGSESCPAAFINDSKDTGMDNNCELLEHEETYDIHEISPYLLYVRASRQIQPGDQLFLNYSKSYWKAEG